VHVLCVQLARLTLKELAIKVKAAEGMPAARRLLGATTLDLSSADLAKDTILKTLAVRWGMHARMCTWVNARVHMQSECNCVVTY
jgi:hypothetical protein